ncbi:MAG: hypothetical protein GSR72_05980 [Desulfurococcales archaeon]|nr:hypothetical protein [Desulfurococcales archaeon]MEB3789420.1 hypothetical protein [Desulfurococcales archaeon]
MKDIVGLKIKLTLLIAGLSSLIFIIASLYHVKPLLMVSGVILLLSPFISLLIVMHIAESKEEENTYTRE